MATALQAYPFDSVDTTETQFGKLFGLLQDDGIADLPTSSSGQVTAGGGLTLNVAAFAAAYLSGGVCALPAPATVALDAAAAQTRIDRVVIRFDWTANTAVVDRLTGVPGAGAPKTLTQTRGGIYEISLARITVAAGAVNLSSANIVDEREFTSQRVLVYATGNRPDAAAVGVALGINFTSKRLELSDGTSWSTVGSETPVAGTVGFPGTVSALVDASGTYLTSVTRANGRATLNMGVNVGANGINLSNARLILGVDAGSRPVGPAPKISNPHFLCQVYVGSSFTGIAGFYIAANGQVLFNYYTAGGALPANAHVHGTVTYDIGN